MFSRWSERLRHALGLRLALWYAVVFVASCSALVALTYFLLAASLHQYDRQTIQTTLVRYAAAYSRGGLDGLAREIRTTQIGADPGPMFVRVVGEQYVVFTSMPEEWKRFDLSQLADAPLTTLAGASLSERLTQNSAATGSPRRPARGGARRVRRPAAPRNVCGDRGSGR